MMANAAAAAAIAPPPPPPKAAAPFPPLPSENPDEEGALGLPPLPAPPPIIPEAPTRLEQTKVPLAWTAAKVGPAVNISGDGATASRSASGCGAQLTSEWMQGGRHPHVYHIVLALDEVMPETMIGIVGKNFWPSDWSEPLAKSLHSIVLECGTGKFFVKGKATSFMLKPLTSGARLHMMLDMQVQEMTLELLGTSPGQILSSVTIEAVPAEVTLVVGFCAGGPQSVRVVACTKELPEMKLLGKHGGRKGGDVIINVTAMVDMMMVLVIFLVMNFNASGEMLFLSKDIKMPGAENGDSVTRVPIVSISNKNQLYFEGVILTDLNNIDPNDPNWRIAELEEKLFEWARDEGWFS
jgi:biopolymer transport protein ExbD